MGGRAIVVDISLNCYGYNEEGLKREWIEDRIFIFMKYTLQSLLAQTNPCFDAFIRYHPDSEADVLELLGCFRELPEHVRFINQLHYAQAIAQAVEGTDEVYFVRLDSDDLIHHSYVQHLHDFSPQPDTQAIITPSGYMYDANTHQIASEVHSTPSCYCLVYSTAEFLALAKYHLQRGHAYVLDLKHETLPAPLYVRVIHDRNTMIRFVLRNKTEGKIAFYHYNLVTTAAQVDQILDEFM